VKSQVRLYCLLARDARKAVVFRRGPTRRVLLLTWDLATDTVTEGQWLNGRIYERRCDLAPEGDLLLYFAASYRKPYYSWSAVSRPPYFTALALWPKGDGWGGGGHFAARDRIHLNHREAEMKLGPGFELPPWLTVTQLPEGKGWGEDDPVWSMRLERDGWLCTHPGGAIKEDFGGEIWITYNPPVVREKRHPLHPETYALRMIHRGVKQQNGPWYVMDHELVADHGGGIIEGSLWADWDPSGDLLYAQGAALHRLPFRDGALADLREATLVADLSAMTFRELAPPEDARRWPRS
jgi:hypothetical protein